MAVETKRVTCAPGVYTRIAENCVNCSFVFETVGTGRVVIAATQPSIETNDYVPASSEKSFEIGSMSGTEDVWFMPATQAAANLFVMRG